MALGHETGMQHVQNLLAQATHFYLYNSNSNIRLWSYFENLSDFLRTQEQQFYKALGVEDIKGLNNLLQTINIDYHLNDLNAGGKIYNQIRQDYILTDASTKTQSVTREDNIMQLFAELINNSEIGQNMVSEFLDRRDSTSQIGIFSEFFKILTTVFNKTIIPGDPIHLEFTANNTYSQTGYYKKNGILGEASIKLNFGKILVPGDIKIDKNQFVVTGQPSDFPKAVKSIVASQVRPALMEYLNKETSLRPYARDIYDKNPQEWRDIVNRYIKENFPKIDLAFSNNIELNHSSGSVSGYLGEIQSHLYFVELFKNVTDSRIIDAGASYIKSMSGGVQMDPADTVIEIANHIFNIQVKNYMKGGAEWGGNTKSKVIQTLQGEKKIRDYSTAEGFVLNRLQIHDSNLLEFFGAATWHNLNTNYAGDPKYDEYAELYQNFNRIFDSLKESFDTFLPNIIRLTAILDGVEDLQYENFYFQKGTMIPASAIVDCILDGLMGAKNVVFTSSYEMYPGASHFTYQHPFEDDYGTYAKETTITWKVTINFNSVLRSIGL